MIIKEKVIEGYTEEVLIDNVLDFNTYKRYRILVSLGEINTNSTNKRKLRKLYE